MNNNPMKLHCVTCHELFTPGVDGVLYPPTTQGPACDKCLGIVRDKKGAPWYPREVEHLVTNVVTGKVETVTKEQAFAPPPPQEAFKKAFGGKKE